MSEARCDLAPVLDPGVWAKLPDPEKVRLLVSCGCRVLTDGDGWVARFTRGDRIRGPDRQLVLEQTRGFLAVSPGLWPLVSDSQMQGAVMPTQMVPSQKPAPGSNRGRPQQVNGVRSAAIAYQTRTLTLAIRAVRAAPWQFRHYGATAAAVDEALGIAFAHCLEAARTGQSPCDMLQEIGIHVSPLTSWGDAIARLAVIWLVEVWPKLPDCGARGPS